MTTPDRPIGAGLAGGGLWPAHVPRPVAAPPVAAIPQGAGADALPPEVSSERWPWRGVQWSLTYVGFLGYIYAITTYRFPIGDVSIVLALIGLLTTKEPIANPGTRGLQRPGRMQNFQAIRPPAAIDLIQAVALGQEVVQ